jgi:putative copper export protein
MPKPIIFGVVSALHNLFTAIWIGGLLTTALSFMPAFKETKEKVKGLASLLVSYQNRLSTIVLVSVIGLWITGMLLGKQSPAYSGFMNFSTTYNVLLSIKHLLIFVMILVAIYRRFVLGQKIKSFDDRQQKLYGMLLIVNTVLGVIVVFLSGMGAALG